MAKFNLLIFLLFCITSIHAQPTMSASRAERKLVKQDWLIKGKKVSLGHGASCKNEITLHFESFNINQVIIKECSHGVVKTITSEWKITKKSNDLILTMPDYGGDYQLKFKTIDDAPFMRLRKFAENKDEFTEDLLFSN